MKTLLVKITSIFIVSCIWGRTNAQVPSTITNPLFDSAKLAINRLVLEEELPSASVAVFKNGKAIWVESFGYANKKTKERAKPNTIYPIASITKSFTATAIMLLVEEGKIVLDDPIRTYFDTNPIHAYFEIEREVTVRDLLQHTSGLGMYYRNIYSGEGIEPEAPNQLFAKYNALIYQPGKRFEYSNLGYTVLGELVSKVSGMTYDEFLKTRVIKPLGLKSTTIRLDELKLANYAKLYGAKNELLPFVYTDTKAAGDLYSNAYDLAKFGLAHLPGFNDLLTKKLLLEMRSNHNQADIQLNDCELYGLGWFYEADMDDEAAFWHEGGLDGAHAVLRVIPSENVVVAVLTNATFIKGQADKLANQIVGLAVPNRKHSNCKQKEKVVDPVVLSGVYEGQLFTYSDTLGLKLEFLENGEITAFFVNHQTRFIFTNDQPFPQKTFVNYANITGNHLSGFILEGMIPSVDWNQRHHIVQLNLYKEGNQLNGDARAFDANQIREGAATAFYVTLTKIDEGSKKTE